MKKKYSLGMLMSVVALTIGACQSSVKDEKLANDEVKQDLIDDVEQSKTVKTNYYSESLFMLPEDHSFWETTSLDLETIRQAKMIYATDENESTSNDGSSNNNGSTSNDGSSNNSGSTSNGGSLNNSGSISNGGSSNNSGSISNGGSSNNSGSTSNGGSSQPTPPVEESKKPVDILDWNYIKSTLITKGENLGMRYESRATLDDGYESPWQSSYMNVTNEDVIGYISAKMERCANSGQTWFGLEMVVQSDGNVSIYLIR